jgi:hypothetical protein
MPTRTSVQKAQTTEQKTRRNVCMLQRTAMTPTGAEKISTCRDQDHRHHGRQALGFGVVAFGLEEI